jgi:hypothetical protein
MALEQGFIGGYFMGFRPAVFRFKLLVFPKFQLTLIAINVGITLLVCLSTWYQIWRTLDDLRPMAPISGMEVQVFNRYLEYQARQVANGLGLSLLVGLSGSIILTLLFSQRLIGPLVRLMDFFRSMASGSAPIRRLNFRRNDFLGELPPLVNDALDALETGRAAVPEVTRLRNAA